MKKKLLVLATGALLAAAMLTGCGKKVTVESLLDGMSKDVESQTADVEFDIALTVKAEGMEISGSVSGDIQMQSSGLGEDADESINYMDGDVTVKLEALGVNEKAPLKMYTVTEDDTVTTYTYNEDDDTWYYTEADVDDSGVDQDTINEVREAMMDALKENGELAEDTKKVSGEECYVITATLEGDAFKSMLEPMEDAFEDALRGTGVDIMDYMDFFTAEVTYYISKDSGYLVKSEIDFADSDIMGLLEQAADDAGSSSMLDSLEKISFDSFYFAATMSDINNTEVKLPRDVKNNAVEAGSASDLLGGMDDLIGGGSDYDDDDYDLDDDDYDWDDDDDDDYTSTSSGIFTYRNGVVTLPQCMDSSALLAEIKCPDNYEYDDDYSSPANGYFYFNYGGDTWKYLYIQNEAGVDLYYYLLNGDIPEGYAYETTTIGRIGGSDCLLVRETVEDGDTNVYLCVEYDDSSFREWLTIAFVSMDDVIEGWSDEDFFSLAKEMLDGNQF